MGVIRGLTGAERDIEQKGVVGVVSLKEKKKESNLESPKNNPCEGWQHRAR